MNRFDFRPFILWVALFLVSVGAARAAQYCSSHIPRSTPDADFVDHGDGTVTHKETGLMWSKCLLGLSGDDCEFITDDNIHYTWQEALEAAEASTLAGYNDWRLPNIKELASIVELACYAPTINLTIFPNNPTVYVWSSSPGANNYPRYAWVLSFYLGMSDMYGRHEGNHVRLVRGGQ